MSRKNVSVKAIMLRPSCNFPENNRDEYDFMPFYLISSYLPAEASFSPRKDDRLTADWHTPSFLVMAIVVIPSFRCAQKHNRLRAFTVCCDFPAAVT